ncbi:MAG: putative carbon monoxide dehydrogenase medium subunit, coxM-like protein [Hyphomicrobiales bacterium]|nr:putative carbon monoxide dehydrogenase medium subunit, coxM-like protein [Hyphomicrobiales bacterium]
MYEFDYRRAASVEDAVAALRASGEAKILAGGMTLLPTCKMRLARPSQLVDLGRLQGLKGIEIGDADVTIRAMTRHADVAASAELRRALPALAGLAAGIGDAQVRNRGTIGGSVANNDPAADYPSACLGLAATIVTDRREIAADDFFQGLFQTALAEDEIIVAIRFPRPVAAAYEKFKNPASRYATVGVFVARSASGVRVAVTGASENGVFRATAIEAALQGSFTPDAAATIRVPSKGLASDFHGSADYRAHLIPVLAARAVQTCLSQA